MTQFVHELLVLGAVFYLFYLGKFFFGRWFICIQTTETLPNYIRCKICAF